MLETDLIYCIEHYLIGIQFRFVIVRIGPLRFVAGDDYNGIIAMNMIIYSIVSAGALSNLTGTVFIILIVMLAVFQVNLY